MFITAHDRKINLKNVSNINIIHNRKRIVFNFNHSIDISDKLISGYYYWDFSDNTQFNSALDFLTTLPYIEDNFISLYNSNGFINKNEISSIKYISNKKRVIFNLSNAVTFKDFKDNVSTTSEFVYATFETSKQYSQYVNYVNKAVS